MVCSVSQFVFLETFLFLTFVAIVSHICQRGSLQTTVNPLLMVRTWAMLVVRTMKFPSFGNKTQKIPQPPPPPPGPL